MIRRSLIAAALVAFATPVLAAENPVKVTADTFVVDQNAATATFSGNVVVIRDDLTVWADKVEVRYGKGGIQDIETLVASGHVKLKTTDQEAVGATATFSPKTQILKLSGNVTVTNSSGTLNGPELVLNLAEQTTVFSSKGGGRVTGVFTPQ
jgi:lipopolysaccharide export system protein LptA